VYDDLIVAEKPAIKGEGGALPMPESNAQAARG